MRLLINWLAIFLAFMAVAYLLPGFHVEDWVGAAVAAALLGIFNAIIRPILFVLTLPITILTLGLFALVVNGLVLWLAVALVPGVGIDNLGWAILAAILIAILNALIGGLLGRD